MAQPKINPIRRIYDILRDERRDIWAIYFYAILSGLVTLSLPLGIQAIVSFLMAGTISASLVLLIVLVVIGVIITGLLQVNQQKITEKIQQELFIRYAFQYTHVLPRLNLRETGSAYLPELVNRFFDTVTLQKGISKLLLDIPAATIQILFGLLLLSFYHPVFIFFGALLLLVLYLILRVTGNRGLETSREESDYKYKVAGHLEELARAVLSFKFGRTGSLHLRKTDAYSTGYLNARTAHFRILMTQYWTLIVFKVLITAGMLIVGATLLIQQKLNIGQFVATEIVILSVINSIEKLIVNLDTVYDVLTSVEKVSKVIDKPLESSGPMPFPDRPEGASLQVRDLSFSYEHDGRPVLRNVSFEVAPGEKICIEGPSGAGKSTLLRVLSGVYQPFGGSILLDRQPLSQYELDQLRASTGILLSSQDIFEGTLWENLTLGNDAIQPEKVLELAETVGLLPFIESLEKGLQAPIQAAGMHLSARTIRKILLLRALIPTPRLLLLEQPWLYLDATETARVQDLLLQGFPATTMLVVSTDEAFARQCNRVLVLKDGVSVSFAAPGDAPRSQS